MENHEERVEDWGSDIIAAYVRIAKPLAALALPIQLPMNMDDPKFIEQAIAAIVRTVTLVSEQPMDRMVQVVLTQVLMDWLTAFDLAALELAAPQPWREGVFHYTLVRIVGGADLALNQILNAETLSDE